MAQYVLINKLGTRRAGEIIDTVQDPGVVPQLSAFGGVLILLPSAPLQPYIEAAQLAYDRADTSEAQDIMMAGYASTAGGGGGGISGSGTPGTLPIWTASSTLGDSAIVQVAGAITTLTLTTAGTGGTAGTYRQQALTNVTGTGSGATADISVAAGAVTQVFLRGPGTGYAVGNTLSAAIAGLTGAVFTVTAITTSNNAAGNVTANRIAAGSSSATTGLSTNAGLLSTTAPLLAGTNSSATVTQFRAMGLFNMDGEPSNQAAITSAEATIPAGVATVARWNFAARTSNTTAYGTYANASIATQNASASGFAIGGVFIATSNSPTLSGASLNSVGVYSNATVTSGVTAANTITTLYGYDTLISVGATGIQTVSNAGYFVPRAAVFSGAAHVVSTFYGVWLPTTTLLNGSTITNRYGVYQQDPAATNFWFGKTTYSASATSDTAGNTAAQIIAIQNGGLSYLWMRQRATDTSISIDSYGSAWAEALRINANNTAGGANTVQLPTAGWGLKLNSTTGNTDTQALDCYLEGSYTPTPSLFTGTSPTISASYTRVGRLVTLTAKIAPTAGAAWGATQGGTSFSYPTGITPAGDTSVGTGVLCNASSGATVAGVWAHPINNAIYLPNVTSAVQTVYLSVQYFTAT